jgi:hypothetical protein
MDSAPCTTQSPRPAFVPGLALELLAQWLNSLASGGSSALQSGHTASKHSVLSDKCG